MTGNLICDKLNELERVEGMWMYSNHECDGTDLNCPMYEHEGLGACYYIVNSEKEK